MKAKKEMGGYELLASAVVIQAVKDYRIALVDQHEQPLSNVCKSRVRELERFFKGEDIMIYTKLDGERLMERVRDEVIRFDYDLKALYKSHGDIDEEEWL